uniref:ADP/ATP translocase n=1 Tax=Vannella robusta TaxID=1487602 RepID=A0A7S4M3J7_9EUKA
MQSIGSAFLFGGLAAGVSKTVVAPVETIKLLLQNQNALVSSGVIARPYNGIWDCLRRTVTNDGFLALWQGNTLNVLRYFPTQICNFAIKDSLRSLIPKRSEGYYMWFIGNTLTGTVAGAISLLFVYPMDYVRTRLGVNVANVAGQRKFSGAFDVLAATVASQGITGCYRGFWISVVGIFVYRASYFGLYDTTMAVIPAEYKKGFLMRFLLGLAVTTAAGLITYPLDTIRRRMMMSVGEPVVFHSAYSCTKYIIENEGVIALFEGAIANTLRGLAGAAVLVIWDNITSPMKK